MPPATLSIRPQGRPYVCAHSIVLYQSNSVKIQKCPLCHRFPAARCVALSSFHSSTPGLHNRAWSVTLISAIAAGMLQVTLKPAANKLCAYTPVAQFTSCTPTPPEPDPSQLLCASAARCHAPMQSGFHHEQRAADRGSEGDLGRGLVPHLWTMTSPVLTCNGMLLRVRQC